jgi:nitrite reductase/ring-hydroxylating ferredoxin subunit
MKNNYNRTVELNCPVCHGNDFDSTDGTATCKKCRCTFTKQQLQDTNRSKINTAVENVKKDVFNDIKTDFQKMLKKSFGSNFKIK